MNTYVLSFFELFVFGGLGYYIGQFIKQKTNDDTLVNLNNYFWVYLVLLSILTNFKMYLYFGSVFVVGLLFFAVYIYKIVRVITFVENDMNLVFWMLFGIFFIPILVLFITKGFLIDATISEAPMGLPGELGQIGKKGDGFFIENLGDKAYVILVNEIENYLREIYDKNELDYDKKDWLFKNTHFKDNLKRICNSKQFINQILRISDEGENIECRYSILITTQSSTGAQVNNPQRYCYRCDSNELVDPQQKCVKDSDCSNYVKLKDDHDKFNLSTNAVIDNPIYNLINRVKYWVRLILENNCEDDRKLRKKLKINEIYSLEDAQLGFKDNFNQFQQDISENNYGNLSSRCPITSGSITNEQKESSECRYYIKEQYLKANTINYFRMNNLMGKKYLTDYFYTDKYWEQTNVEEINGNPFTKIRQDEYWNWGRHPNFQESNEPSENQCTVKSHPVFH